ncbi:hypothetical protein YQE_07841, partial [Dendroctonus ponderosae]
MTSTNIYQGMHDTKNSSKVMKPPGGAHTDIFGAPSLPVNRDSGRNASSITEGTNAEVEGPVAPMPHHETKSEPPAAAGSCAPSTRQVPPGGFSSGPFW